MTLDVMANSLVYWSQDLFFSQLFAPGARIFAMTSAGDHIVWPAYGAVSAAKAARVVYRNAVAPQALLDQLAFDETHSTRSTPSAMQRARAMRTAPNSPAHASCSIPKALALSSASSC